MKGPPTDIVCIFTYLEYSKVMSQNNVNLLSLKPFPNSVRNIPKAVQALWPWLRWLKYPHWGHKYLQNISKLVFPMLKDIFQWLELPANVSIIVPRTPLLSWMFPLYLVYSLLYNLYTRFCLCPNRYITSS